MKVKALGLLLICVGCGDKSNPATPAPEEQKKQSQLSCELTLDGQGEPQRETRFEYVVKTNQDGSKKSSFKVSYEIFGNAVIAESDFHNYQPEDSAGMHAVSSVAHYVAFAHGDHAHLYDSVTHKDTEMTCVREEN